MTKTAITGGIGSGKSYVCRLLAQRGIPVYDCDAAAKRLMRSSDKLKDSLRQLVGNDVYTADGTLQKRILAEFLLASEQNKQAVNDIVHPAVANDFRASGMEWLESAILFESGFDRRVAFDHTVCVCAPRQTRIQRIVQRDSISEAKAAEWIDAQMPQDEIIRRSDFRIDNDGIRSLETQIDSILASIGSNGTQKAQKPQRQQKKRHNL